MTTDSTITRLWQRVQATLARGRIFATDDAGPVQTAQMRTGPNEIIDGLSVVLHYGIASRPPVDTLALALFADGDRGGGVVVATHHPSSRLKNLQPGEAALHDDQGRWVWLKAGGIEIEANGAPVTVKGASTATIEATTKVILDTPVLECTGDILDHSDSNGVTLKELRDAYNAHKHTGVQAGGGTSGPTDTPAT